VRALAAGSVLCVLGCQTLLGFEDFETIAATDAGGTGGSLATGGTGGSLATGGTGGSRATGGATSTGGSTTDPGGAGSGSGARPSPAGSGGAQCHAECDGLEARVDAVSCRGVETCTAPEPHCNPRSGKCIGLGIDATEVTMKDYLAWAEGAPAWDDPPEACAWRSGGFIPDDACMKDVPCALHSEGPPSAERCEDSTLPVVCVDWCSASAYCAARGARLCGSLRGGLTHFSDVGDAGESAWTNACSAGGQYRYGSGDPPAALETCSYGGREGLRPVGSDEKCHSPSPGYASLFDMLGNAAEWEDACEPVNPDLPGENDQCAVRGGSYDTPQVECTEFEKRRRGEPRSDIGFRCCESVSSGE
jgi:hypothetical protein